MAIEVGGFIDVLTAEIEERLPALDSWTITVNPGGGGWPSVDLRVQVEGRTSVWTPTVVAIATYGPARWPSMCSRALDVVRVELGL